MRRLRFTLPLVAIIALPGCSVYMAATGTEEPSFANVHEGATRGEVEATMGTPVAVTTTESGSQIATYDYTKGNSPSPGRAAMHGALDLFTLCLWEPFGTAIEATNQGTDYQMLVTYDATGHVTNIQTSKR